LLEKSTKAGWVQLTYPAFVFLWSRYGNIYSVYAKAGRRVLVKVTLRNKEYEVTPNQTVQNALESLGLQPEAYLVVKDGELLTEDIVVREGDVLKLVAVVSGGAED
jgi:sulfur carrier protein